MTFRRLLIGFISVSFACNATAAEITAVEIEDRCPSQDDPAWEEIPYAGPVEDRFWGLNAHNRGRDQQLIQNRLTSIRRACWENIIGTDTIREYEKCHDVATPTEDQWYRLSECTAYSTIGRLSEIYQSANSGNESMPIASQVKHAIDASTQLRELVEEYFAQTGSFPTNNEEAGAPLPQYISSHYVRSVATIGNGRIRIRFSDYSGDAINGAELLIVPEPTESGLRWRCGTASFDASLLPDSCNDLPSQLATYWVDRIVPGGRIGNGYQHGQYPSEGDTTHPGADIGGGCGLPVHAAEKGEVVRIVTQNDPRFDAVGNAVVIRHGLPGDHVYTAYFHMQSDPLVTLGPLGRGVQIGVTGSTGFAYGCHLHFEVRRFEGIDGLFHPTFRNIYLIGDQRGTRELNQDWHVPSFWVQSRYGLRETPVYYP